MNDLTAELMQEYADELAEVSAHIDDPHRSTVVIVVNRMRNLARFIAGSAKRKPVVRESHDVRNLD